MTVPHIWSNVQALYSTLSKKLAFFSTDKISPRKQGFFLIGLQAVMTSDVASNTAGVQYNRWDDNVNLNVAGSQSGALGVYYRVCTGTMGQAVKVAGAVAALVSVYIVGYVTGYYVHRC